MQTIAAQKVSEGKAPRHAGRDIDPEYRRVIDSISRGELVSRDAADLADDQASFGNRLADRVAEVGGSWGFIITFAVVLIGWMLLNTDVLSHWNMAFDPYPYIFLNLMLSTLAAIQAPIIMMSQNRQGQKDRIAASEDYAVNLRAELDIMALHEKFDRAKLDQLEAKLDCLLHVLDPASASVKLPQANPEGRA